MAYTLHFDRRVEKELRTLPKAAQGRIFTSLLKLRENPFASTKKLAGEDSYRIRIGDYRAILDIDTARQRVTVLKVAHRKDVYRR